ncbi:Brain mitochondrial carrier protein 1 [Hondaea fermentalgiana]|uniref:Brain mitochondrial carrier protein 1 n=1 Tax=Hondaea fermentalgiana TaxID=2315210 RepID=A0A2R5GIX1_9STRA|nr:Brain mitochondrial carrier protein 1 [Hondaea fermentalgiana]|eukprot:GBG30836.1 Brain mitochondrial carrier protein 1 [Hondaea fermentalgiana]
MTAGSGGKTKATESGGKNDDHASRFGASLVASGVAEFVTLPIDAAKVRLQVQHNAKAGGVALRYAGMLDCMVKIQREEGSQALWRGLAPALVRQCLYTSASLVLYEPIRDSIVGVTGGLGDDGGATYMQRLLSGGTAGAISISIFNWTEVLKTRMQTSSTRVSVFSIASQVMKQDGILGFWAGLKPNVIRTFLVNAAELGTYDHAKQSLIPVVGDNAVAHLGASSLSGVCSALVSTPSDVIKTRLMNAAGQSAGDRYTGIFDAIRCIVRDEGVSALYKGFVPICTRKVAWCSSFFLLYEQLRSALNY